jgi:Na+/H+-dicarboxylate symporter
MAAGALAGIVLGERATAVEFLGELFIRLLMMAAIPLVVFNLLAGITSLEDVRVLGRVGGKILAYYLGTTVLALMLGIAVMRLLRPGRGLEISTEADAVATDAPGAVEVLLDLIPENVARALAQGDLVQLVMFSVLLGIATVALPADGRAQLKTVFGDLAAVLRKLVELILIVAPLGIGALAAATVGRYGSALFGPLAMFILGVWGAQVAMVGVYLVLLYAFTGRSPFEFLRRTGPLYATTAATCSSLASMVVAFELAEERLRLPRSIYSFTLPLGAQINKDGTAIMLVGVLLITAQAAGVEFQPASHVTILLMGLMFSAGSGGIPGGGLVVALIFVEAFELPPEIAAIVGGIYRLIDMGNTTVNVMGDLVGTTIIANAEGGAGAVVD